MINKTLFGACRIWIIVCLFAVTVEAQDQWSWPEKTENVQVLNKDWPGKRLAPVMRGFSMALGVRCSYCHVGQEGQPLSTFDFASDDNPNKERTREMLRLLGSVNDHLDKIEVSGDQPVNMWCHTCHRGRPRPMTLSEEMTEAYRLNGAEAALAQYVELKENYYGKGMYNFEDEFALNALGYEILGKDDTAGAIPVFEMNAKKFPDSGNVWDSLAEAYMKAGDNGRAEKYFKKSLKLDPSNQNAKDMLEKLKE